MLYAIHSDKPQMFKTFPLGKINITKNHSFTFNLRFLCELTHKVYLSKIVRGIFHFRFRLDFIEFTFLFHEKHVLVDLKTSKFLSKLK